MRKFWGALGGTVVGVGVQSALVYVSALIYPQPAPRATTLQQIAQQLSDYYATRPAGSSILYVASYLLAALFGAIVARAIGRSNGVTWVPIGLVTVIALIIAFVYPEPAWAQFGAIFAALVGGLIGRRLVGAVPEDRESAANGDQA